MISIYQPHLTPLSPSPSQFLQATNEKKKKSVQYNHISVKYISIELIYIFFSIYLFIYLFILDNG